MNTLRFFWNSIIGLMTEVDAPSGHDPFDDSEILCMDLLQLADLPLPGLPLAAETDADTAVSAPIELARCA